MYLEQKSRQFQQGSPAIKPFKAVYSKASDSGPSEIGTVYNKPLNKGHCLGLGRYLVLQCTDILNIFACYVKYLWFLITTIKIIAVCNPVSS